MRCSLPHPPDALPALDDLAAFVRDHRSVQDKLSIHRTYDEPLGTSVPFEHPFAPEVKRDVRIGDDCAALPNGTGGYLLFAAEGMLPAFVQNHPWFAGYAGVLVNLSDICAMGGLPLAITDMLWAKDRPDGEAVWEGMRAASETYGVPIVGGHTSYRCDHRHLGVAVLGQAQRLLTSYDAQPGETLLMAIDLDGRYFQDDPFWDAATDADADRLRALLRLPHAVAERGWSRAGKDISMGGLVGTLAMLLHTSEVGATLRLDTVPKPPDVPWRKWLVSFPSFGFLLTAASDHVDAICELFSSHDIACAAVGQIESERGLRIASAGQRAQIS
jgi:AIR synthase-related protein